MTTFLTACALMAGGATVLSWVGDRYERERSRRAEWRQR